MKTAPSFHAAIFLIILLCSGCTKTYWDEKWIYDRYDSLTENQTVRIESRPSAAVWIDGKYIGQTPVETDLSYAVHQIHLEKKQYKETPGSEKEVLDEKQKTETIPAPTRHALVLKAPGYHDLRLPLEIPRDTGNISVSLRQKAGINYRIECILTVNASEGDFPVIENIITEHALTEVIKRPRKPEFQRPPDICRQTFLLTVKDADDFESLSAALSAEAKKRHFVFNASDARAEATFSANPDREFRAVWVSYLDWPRGETDSGRQQQMLADMLDEFRRLKFNAVIFHVRVEADAFYETPEAPWSRFLTGVQGKSPGYDPLTFAIGECHKRGLELHAWLNPFRTKMSFKCTDGGVHKDHISRTHPEWVLQFRLSHNRTCCCYHMLNPGIPEVVEHVAGVAEDIVKRYDVDGIHFDDMFYPYPYKDFNGIRSEDLATYRKYKKGNIAIEDWRRQNVNRFMERVNAGVKKVKPHVRFGVSPFGVWKNGTPPGVRGMSAHDVIYSDALAWLADKSVDYLSPQLYWNIGGNQDYAALVAWWAEKAYAAKRHVYPGQILYYVQPDSRKNRADAPASLHDIFDQIHVNRKNGNRNVLGNAFYRALNRNNDILGTEEFKDLLRNGLFANTALPPVMPWLSAARAAAPADVQLTTENERRYLKWNNPDPDSTVWKYAVYAAHHEDMADGAPLDAAAWLMALTGGNSFEIREDMGLEAGDLLFVRAVSRNNVESLASEPVMQD